MATSLDRYRNCLSSKNDKVHTVQGTMYPGNAERHTQIRNLKIKPDDIFVVCYPKSGTHWLERILSFLKTEGDLDQVNHHPFIPLEVTPPSSVMSPIELVEKSSSPRLIISHLPFELCPDEVQAGKCKIILVIRNPKDVAVSHFYFHKKLKGMGDFTDLSWDDYIEAFCDPSTMIYGSWFLNVKNWLSHRLDGNVHVVLFEDLKKNLAKEVSSVAEFIGRPVTAERAADIAERAGFSGMMNSATAQKSGNANAATTGKTGNAPLSMFMRKGIVGDWKTHFTVAQNEMFDQVYQTEMAGIDLDLEYE